MTIPVSVVVNTLNAEQWLDYALRSVAPWAAEIVVVDMHSNDRTREIAAAHGARVLLHDRTGYVEPARAFAVAQATHEWVLILDADELVPEPLSRALLALAADARVEAVRIPRLNYMMGEPMKATGWQPAAERHLRFFRRGRVVLPEQIHGVIAPRDPLHCRTLSPDPAHALVHFNCTDVEEFLERIDRYTTIEAQTATRPGAPRASALRALGMCLGVGFNRLVQHRAFVDGWRGIYLALTMVFYHATVYAKRRQLETIGDRNGIVARYRAKAEALLERYPR